MKRTKPTPDKTFQTKDPLTKSPDKNPREQLRENLYKGLLSEFFILCVGEVGASWRGNQFSYKLSATIMPIYLFFLHNIPIDNSYISQKAGIIIFYKFAKNDHQIFLKDNQLAPVLGQVGCLLGARWWPIQIIHINLI